MGIRRIDHVQIGFPTGDLARIRHFYGELLGLTEWRGGAGSTLRFQSGAGTRVDLVPTEHWQTPSEPAHLAFEVEDLPGLRARLLAQGVSIDEDRPLAGHRRFYANDPAGNALEFLEPDASARVT